MIYVQKSINHRQGKPSLTYRASAIFCLGGENACGLRLARG
ncbi:MULTISPECIES: hypothetical protein [Serratia]|uniref:Uncharacterized protein n=1 Tax=Serratia fonticola TaxID=47917 RepID=A0AAJ1YGK7_SERFO|nr:MULTISPECIES: hypothetical protein [Serratia]MDQ7211035.1 hypothetical protein [Serratia fonticola]MDQ9127850.1 hypothetical protein [Serratia fonticola]